jgi:hypothetical protein
MPNSIPHPCIRRENDGFILEFKSGAKIPFATDRDAKRYVIAKRIHKDYDICWYEYEPNRYEVFKRGESERKMKRTADAPEES